MVGGWAQGHTVGIEAFKLLYQKLTFSIWGDRKGETLWNFKRKKKKGEKKGLAGKQNCSKAPSQPREVSETLCSLNFFAG